MLRKSFVVFVAVIGLILVLNIKENSLSDFRSTNVIDNFIELGPV